MQLRPDQLAAHIAKGLKPIYTVHGDEPLLAQEAGDAIRAASTPDQSKCWPRRRR